MITDPDNCGKDEINFIRNEKISIKFVLQEGRGAAREHQTQDAAFKLVFNVLKRATTAPKHALTNLKLRKQ